MAAEGYITVDTGKPMGALAIAIHDRIVDLLSVSETLGEALGQAASDDSSNAKLQSILGTATTDDAAQVKDLIGSVRSNLNDTANAFLQYAARINRAGF